MNTRLEYHGRPRLVLLLVLLLLTLGGWMRPAFSASVYHVSTNGQDTADGLSELTAFRTIQRAADLAGPGDRILVQSGTYREYLAFPRGGTEGHPIQLMAADGARPVVAGSEVVTNWVHWTNAIWRVPDWPVDPQQIFDEGQPVTKLGWPNRYFEAFPNRYFGAGSKTLADLAPNTFYYDPTNLVLYLWLANDASPVGRTIEVSTRLGQINTRNLWGFTNAWYDVRGLTFRHCNTISFSEFGWPGVWLSDHSRLEDCRVEWCDATGFSLGSHTEVINCDVHDNGINGGAAARDFLIKGCRLFRNNYRNFSTVWTAAAMKFIPDLHGTIEDCEIAHNKGPAIWFDSCRTGEPIVIRNNYIHHNSDNAIFIEITKNASVYNNLLVSNHNRSIYISSAENTRVHHNTIVDHQSLMTVEMFFSAGRRDENEQVYPLANNVFANNIVYGSRALRELLMFEEEPPFCTNNVSDYNCFYRPGGATFIVNRTAANGTFYSSLAGFQNNTPWDAHSFSSDPRFLHKEGGDFHLRSTAGVYSNGTWTVAGENSPCIDTGDPRQAFAREPTWNGGRSNMGRYANTSEASRSADADGDGVSDPLEQFLLGSNPASAHSDEDGMTDYEEYVAGTDPNDPDSRLRLAIRALEAEGVPAYEVSWRGVRERRYELQFADDPGGPEESWRVHAPANGSPAMAAGEWEGTNGILRALDPAPAGGGQRFYRLRVAWP